MSSQIVSDLTPYGYGGWNHLSYGDVAGIALGGHECISINPKETSHYP